MVQLSQVLYFINPTPKTHPNLTKYNKYTMT